MKYLTDNEVVAVMILAVGTFLICLVAISAVMWYSYHNKTENQPDETMPDCILDDWTYNEKTGY